jgi:hypothetical protein
VSLAQLHRDVVFGKAGGRIIWQPRILCWYDDRVFSGVGLPERYEGMDQHEIHRSLGCSARLYEFNSCFRRIEHPAVEATHRALSDTDTETTIHTPVGKQAAVHRRSPNSPHPITIKWEVEAPEELKVATWREANATWAWDQEQYDAWLAKAGDLGAPTMFMPRMNVQCLYIEKMGVENAVYAIFEREAEVATFFRELDGCHDRLIDVLNASPIEIVNFGENVHAGTLSPDFFLKYHLPECRRRCDRLHEAGKFVTSHWDGDTGPLLPYARETGLDGIEAITPKPQGDVTLEQIKEGLGDEMFLVDGIPAVYFDDTYPVETLIETTERLIDLFAPRLVLGISDEISSTGDIERVRIVGNIVDRYNARFDRGNP